jgi:hypothetical protein
MNLRARVQKLEQRAGMQNYHQLAAFLIHCEGGSQEEIGPLAAELAAEGLPVLTHEQALELLD